jgi:ubiquinone/menaquinone biosynthesis C-methylase UbiE
VLSQPKARAKVLSNFDFRFMSLGFKIRDIFRPRRYILEETNIKTGCQVLDFGCGSGSYIIPVIELIGDLGTLYALDIHPLAIKSAQRLAAKKRLSNVRTILSDSDTGLPPSSIDVALLYDTLHDLEDSDTVLAELHRILKPEGILSVNDHHLKEEEIISRVIKSELFQLKSKGKRTLNFSKEKR